MRKAGWKMREKSKEGLLCLVSQNLKKLSWMNRLIMILQSEFDPAAQQFRTTTHMNRDDIIAVAS